MLAYPQDIDLPMGLAACLDQKTIIHVEIDVQYDSLYAQGKEWYFVTLRVQTARL